jgi:hypothetical protein
MTNDMTVVVNGVEVRLADVTPIKDSEMTITKKQTKKQKPAAEELCGICEQPLPDCDCTLADGEGCEICGRTVHCECI